ncbi:hypothetical protein VD0002_g7174 [Verticillium dahliae]|nr:hypothetical protein VdG2_05015 [Verticillium dahliae VDG2]PNH30655.1 hypothetical protein BJF96_g5903 [Verticillium dahliae]PNH52027.1 hypothetical protein VD0003_g5242 [Verticillium dahliae]PNH60461.1 hypothetical protein VD0002_g7174 [Verticillium dahliae]
MDARPQRPRAALPALGNENMTVTSKQSGHQRHKSTGNLQAASRNGALQAAAKRTVFGDVSNVVKGLTSGNGGVGATKGKIPVAADKNTLSTQTTFGFSKPAQRSIAPSQPAKGNLKTMASAMHVGSQNKLAVHNDTRPDASQAQLVHVQASRPKTADGKLVGSTSVDTLQGESILDPTSFAHLSAEHEVQANLGSMLDVNLNMAPSADNGALLHNEEADLVAHLAPAKPAMTTFQPRHHKSQPQLKNEAVEQPLRRTQSRYLAAQTSEPLDHEESKYLDDVTETAYEDALEHILDQQLQGIEGNGHSAQDRGYDDKAASQYPETGGETSHNLDRNLDLALPEQLPAPPMSEPEEYWDEVEEEELYDDQGYTTAHSYKSRGEMTVSGATALLAPKFTELVQRELQAAKEHVEYHRTPDEVEEEFWDVCMVAEYGEDIFEYLQELETRMMPDPHYMDHQSEIQWSMRSVLMDWLVQVHARFSLLPETLFLTVNFIDRFLTFKAVSIGKLQLVGATALLLASKYEEINCPSLEEIVFMVDGSYAVEEILKAERFMLSMLGFELGWPGPMSFLRRISKADDYDLETRTLAKYFLEVTIMDERFVASPPSFLAAGAHCLSRLILKKGDWSQAHVHYSGYTWSQLKSLVRLILSCCESPREHHAAVFEKYVDKRYKRAAEYVQIELKKGFTVPFRSSTGHPSPLMDLGCYENELGAFNYPAKAGQLINA